MESTASYQAYLRSPHKSIKHTTYFECYDHFFARYRGKPVTFIEVGVLGGGSLFMWRDYFGPQARIIGVDLNPDAKKWQAEGFEIYVGSQSDEAFWSRLKTAVGPVDILLDDGGHTYAQQITTTECMLDAISDEGILVVEDTHTSYMPHFGPRAYTFIAYVKQRMDAINHRFGAFSADRPERRIWSVEVVESMVAFRVNRPASQRTSAPTSNTAEHTAVEDFRAKDRPDKSLLNRVRRRIAFVRRIPVLGAIADAVNQFIEGRRFAARKYFN